MNYNANTSKIYDTDEILLKKNKNRFVLFPIKYNYIYKEYKKK